MSCAPVGCTQGLSIHDLTRRSTIPVEERLPEEPLSIHDLTRRSTNIFVTNSLVSSFQFTTSQGGRPDRKMRDALHDAFQFTTSQGGRPDSVRSLHLWPVSFQFTTSQGGRPAAVAELDLHGRSFNSRPHKEVDPVPFSFQYRQSSFNSRPHKEVDIIRVEKSRKI